MSHIEWKAPNIVDLTRIETNDINYIIHKYGVETARNSIVREVKSVFDVYGINVDYRHLSLIADYMTNNGAYRPFNRIGMRVTWISIEILCYIYIYIFRRIPQDF